ncbi:hypothetical protein CONLIGDRAFT_684970 [Coniochaeta ligniaria NRRL 30616]|uniref:Uncharacterized protein n=1 Tax=Coniochaeta ligniaria NRRL 30616 TaxID=1408157 RepID=A0A1J7IVG7_9PEZI|nr:hypothetical protein CONLIGDRAFT_684970 [Coniochaeta ligniaria NRRL 30616]
MASTFFLRIPETQYLICHQCSSLVVSSRIGLDEHAKARYPNMQSTDASHAAEAALSEVTPAAESDNMSILWKIFYPRSPIAPWARLSSVPGQRCEELPVAPIKATLSDNSEAVSSPAAPQQPPQPVVDDERYAAMVKRALAKEAKDIEAQVTGASEERDIAWSTE